jgi:hypothetical protein
MHDLCVECNKRKSDVAKCGCDNVAFCRDYLVCSSCRDAHRRFGTFLRSVSKTKRAFRSNSARNSALSIFHGAIVRFRQQCDADHRDRITNAFDSLRRISAWSEDRDFFGPFFEAARFLPITKEFADSIAQEVKDARFWKLIADLEALNAENAQKAEANAVLGRFMDEPESERQYQAKLMEILNR